MNPDSQDQLVSIICFCKNSASLIKTCIDSVIQQSYRNIEIVVQDGASTDGTREILEEYGDRIRLVSEPDRSPHEAFFKALRRCRGEIIGSCLSDEQLLPHAVGKAVQSLKSLPHCGGVYGDTIIAEDGPRLRFEKAGEPFSVLAYLALEVHFYFSSLFMRRHALEEIGLHDRSWREGAAEFELVAQLGLKYPLHYVQDIFSSYSFTKQGLSQNAKNQRHFAETMALFLQDFCAQKDCPKEIRKNQKYIESVYALRAAENLLAEDADSAERFLAKAGQYCFKPKKYFQVRREFREKWHRDAVGPILDPWRRLMNHRIARTLNKFGLVDYRKTISNRG